VERYVDSDISAYSGKRRPEYLRMLDDVEAGAVGAVVVYHADRLHRHPRELEDFIDLCQRTKTRLATVSGGVDLSTHEGQLIARIQGAVARKESDDKSRRIRRKHEEIANAGKVSGGGSRPYGYEADKRTVRPEETDVIRECARRALAGDSLRSICIDLNARGVAHGEREAVDVADAQADADVGPDQRPARASRRDRGEGGVASDHHTGRDAAAAGEARRPRPAHQPPVPPLSADAALALLALQQRPRRPPA